MTWCLIHLSDISQMQSKPTRRFHSEQKIRVTRWEQQTQTLASAHYTSLFLLFRGFRIKEVYFKDFSDAFRSSVFCPLCCCRILFWHRCASLAFEFLRLFLRVPPSSLSWLGVCFDGSVHWEKLVNAVTSDSYVCARQREQSHVPRTPVKGTATPTLWRTCLTCSVFFCFTPSKRLRLQPAFDVCWTFCSSLCQTEKRPQWTPRFHSRKPPRRIERKEDGGKARGGKTRTERKRD